MNYRVHHVTRYDYVEPVSIGYNRAHLTPRTCAHQECVQSALRVDPVPAVVGQKRADYFGNESVYFTVQTPHTALEITVESEVCITPMLPPDAAATLPWEEVCSQVARDRTRTTLEAYQFCFPSRNVPPLPALADYAAPSFPPGQPLLVGTVDLMHRIHQEFKYDPEATSVSTPLHEVLANRHGVCQDFAHLQIGCLRALGLPARYVSGYILSSSAETEQQLVGADASHAWLAVYEPNFGWIDVDPTNDMLPSSEHITLAWGRDYDEVSPLRGVILGGGRQTLTVGVKVTRLDA